jgi:tetratricopeptide (TPR) repeat protein
MIRKVAILLLISAFVMNLHATAPAELIKQGNEAYSRGEFSYAIELYEQVIDAGLEAPELYYNLGNAYFRENQLGPAILNYERALRLRPNDESVRHNLEVANNRIIDLIEPVPVIFYERWWQQFLSLMSMDEWAIAGIISLVLFLVMLSVYFFSRTSGVKKWAFGLSLLLFIVTFTTFSAAQKQYQRLFLHPEAIVFVPRVTAKSAPGDASPDLFVIHEGSKVKITDELGEWYEVRLANGNVGWVKKQSLEVI